jgi:hypothetical protein
MSMPDRKALELEFDALMAKSDVAVPPELKAGALAVYDDLKRMAALVRQPRAADSEPSNIYNIQVILRNA